MDCDGVLTDGALMLLAGGDEQKTFNVKDGQGIVLFHRAGLRAGIISGRTSSVLEQRAKELGIEFLRQGIGDKVAALELLMQTTHLSADETAFIGDDVGDIPVMRRVGLAVAVADAVAEVKTAAHFVTENKGGQGAVREVTDLILKAQGRWEDLMQDYV